MEEQMQSNFNFDSHSSTNQDLTIVFTPDESVKHYSYSLFNENELIDSNIIEKNEYNLNLQCPWRMLKIRKM